MEKHPYRNIGILIAIALLLFYPVFYVHYFYTDEVLQLWNYRKGSDFAMFVVQGRYITDILFRFLYSHIETIRQLNRLRIFSLIGWICCLPIWYTIIDKVCRKEGLSSLIPFLFCPVSYHQPSLHRGGPMGGLYGALHCQYCRVALGIYPICPYPAGK